MSDKNVYEQLVAFVRSILPPHRDAAVQFFDDPQGVLAAQGFADQDLSGINLSQVVSDACSDPSVPYPVRDAAQSYTGTSHPARSFDHTVTQLQQVTTVVYEGDEYFVDNRTSIDVEHLEGDIDINNVTAQGDGATAAGDDVNQASGSSQIINGDNYGEATNVGERGVNVDLDALGGREPAPVLSRTEGGLGGLLGPSGGLNINTGDGFAGVQGTGPIVNPVVGDHNQVANVQAPLTNSNLNFGDGNSNIAGSAVTDSPQAFGGGTAISQHDISQAPGSALSGIGNSSGHAEDNDTVHDSSEHNLVLALNSNVATEQGDGDQHVDQHQDDHPSFIADPVRVPLHPEAASTDGLDALDDN